MKPIKCPKCGREFTYKSSLNNHRLACGKVTKSYSCAICRHEFSRRTALQDHIHGKHGDQAYYFPDCGKRFNWRSSLAYHTKHHHASD